MDLKQIFSEDELGALGVSVKLSGGLTISQAQKTALVAAIKQAQKAPAAQQLTILAKAKPAGWTAAKFKQVLLALKKELLTGPASVNVKGFGGVSPAIRASALAAIKTVKKLKGKPAAQLQVFAMTKPVGWTTAKFKKLVLALAPDIERWTAPPPPPKKPPAAPKKVAVVAPASTTIQIAGFGPVSRAIRNQSLSAIAAVNKLKGKPAQQLQVLAKAKPAGWTTAKFKKLVLALAPNIEQVLKPTPAKATPKAPTTQVSPFQVAASVRSLVQKAAAPLVAAQRAPAGAISGPTIPLREVQKMFPATPLKAVQAKTAVIIPPKGAQVMRPGALPVTARCPGAYAKLAANAGLSGPSAMKLLAEIRDMVRTVSTRQMATSEHDAINNTNDFRRAVLCGLRSQLRSCS